MNDVARGGTIGREVGLRLACLAVSVGLHAGLGAVSWQSFAVTSTDDVPMMVALVDSPSTASMGAAPSVPAGRRANPPPAASTRRMTAPPEAAPAKPQVASIPVAEPLCAVPAAAVVEATAFPGSAVSDGDSRAPSGSGASLDDSPGTGGAESGSGSATQGLKQKAAGDGRGGLIRATPRYESNPLPHYPRLAKQNRWEGTVRLRARVTAGGDVEAVTLERSSGHAVLDHSAVEGVQHWRFIPATRGGVPVACEVSIPVAFRLTE